MATKGTGDGGRKTGGSEAPGRFFSLQYWDGVGKCCLWVKSHSPPIFMWPVSSTQLVFKSVFDVDHF